MKTVVLTSRENFRWLSMQEILPLIEKNWLDGALPGTHEVVCRNIDKVTLSELLGDLISADNIVFTCFTTKLSRIGEWIRKDLKLDARYFVYLHNQATIYCWPFHVWGMGRHFRTNDVFIGTSNADRRAFRKCFKGGRFEVVPFTLPNIEPRYPIAQSSKRRVPFVYVGRLSDQKNLKTLIQAFHKFQKENPQIHWELSIYGKDDNLGSPNMGMKSKGYASSLRKMCRELNLKNRITFKGFQKREKIHRTLDRKLHVSVSASLHSDENFGMAPFRSIIKGNFAVLTRWGGFADLGESFPQRVLLAPVLETSSGPSVDHAVLASLLKKSAVTYLSKNRKRKTDPMPAKYQESVITSRLRKLALSKNLAGSALMPTPSTLRVLKKRAHFQAKGDNCRIFKSYADADATAMFRSYGMRRS